MPLRFKECRLHFRCAASSSSEGSSDSPIVDEKTWARFLRDFRAPPFDAPPRNWEEDFMYVRTAGVVSETDTDTGEVRAAQIRTPRLSKPKDNDEWKKRLIANVVYYRSNYAWIGLALLAMHWMSISFSLAAAVMCGGVALVLARPTLRNAYAYHLDTKHVARAGLGPDMGTLSPAAENLRKLDGRNAATVVAGIGGVAFATARADLRSTAVAAVCALLASALAVLVHATLRPLSLGASVEKAASALKSAKSREELKEVLKDGVEGLGAWAKDAVSRASEERKGFFFINKVVGGGGAAGDAGAGAAQQQQAQESEPQRRSLGDADGAIDVDSSPGRKRGALPPGSS